MIVDFKIQVNKKLLIYPAALLLSIMSIPVVTYGQDQKNKKGEIEDAEIIIEKNREIILPEANRNFEKITAPAKQPEPVLQKYQYIERTVKLGDLNPRFRVLQMPQEPQKNLTGNYVKVGVGNYLTAYLEGFFNSVQHPDYSYGARVKRFSSMTGPVDKANSASSETQLSVYGKYFTDALTAGISLEYDRDLYHFYGYKPGTEIDSRRDIRQIFNTIALKTNFINNDTKSPLDYRLSVNVINFSDFYEANEFEFGTELKGSYRIADNMKALLNTDLFLTRRKDSTSVNRNFFRIKPAFQYKSDALTVVAGLNTVYENDTVATDSRLHVYPTIHAEYTLLDNFTLFGGLEGDMQRTTLRQLANENPFLGPNVPLLHTNKSRDIYAGLKGKLSQDLSFAARLSYAGYKNLYFYVNSLQDTTKFTVLYDPDFTNVINFSGELNYNHADKLRLGVKADFYNYNPTNLKAAWHRPSFTTTVLGHYNFNNKVFFNTEVYYLGGITAKVPVKDMQVEKELDPILDMNIKLEYLFFDKFSAFLSVNNLLSSKYQRYLYYPNRGLNILIGGTYTF